MRYAKIINKKTPHMGSNIPHRCCEGPITHTPEYQYVIGKKKKDKKAISSIQANPLRINPGFAFITVSKLQ